LRSLIELSKKSQRGILIATLVVVSMYFSFAYAAHDEPRLIVIGDSLSTTHESWPNYLRAIAPRWNIHVMAQNGRTIRDFSIPRDLWTAGDKNETVIYFLGCNDILQNSDVMHATYRLKNHLSFLLDRNFKVLLIIPPHLSKFKASHRESFQKHRALFESFRGTHPNLWIYDMDNVWDNDQLLDGIHPKPGLSYEMALMINMVLGMNIY